MNRKKFTIGAAALVLLGAAGYSAYRYGMREGMQMAGTAPASSPIAGDKVDPATGRRVLYWHDPMVPGQKFDKPGKSPFMDMQLVPVYADEGGGEGTVSIDPRVVQNLGIRTAEVVKGSLAPRLEVVGNIAYNERELVLVQARVGGFVEKLYVRAPLDHVQKGQALVEILAPDWVAAQEEYLALRRMRTSDAESLVAAARQRMLLVGMSEDAIQKLESTGQVLPRATLHAPASGVIAELGVREGMTVMAGAMLFRINALSSVWLNAEVPVAEASGLKPGQPVEAKSVTYPGAVFKGRVSALLPQVNQMTRTVVARIELANSDGRLVPGMFASVDLSAATKKEALLVPSEAMIRTGTRSVVVLSVGEGKFRPVEVVAGSEANGQTEIRKGLEVGQKVVVSGQFLIDSEANLRATGTRMASTEASTAAAPQAHQAVGEILSMGADEFLIKHGAIPSAGMGAMTMPFRAPGGVVPPGFKKNDRVRFEFNIRPDGEFQLTNIAPENASVPDRGARK
jgi:Cu(I)/Ag(I) efflux system membrane fusion protein